MRLTEQEQQEIIRFIEADKPLPDKQPIYTSQSGGASTLRRVGGGLSMDKGAHYHKCDLQVHTPRDRQWNGSE